MKIILFILSFFDFFHKRKIINFFIKKNFNINVFFDVGAHKGETIELFQKNFKIKNFYCFEPSNLNFIFLQNQVLRMKKKNINIYNFAIGDISGTANFKQFKESSSSTMSKINKDSNYYKKKMKILNLFSFDKSEYKEEIVKITTLKKFMDDNSISSIDILKIDTEGYEFNVIKGAENKIRNVKFIYFEHHFDDMIIKNYTLTDIHNYLVQNGFQKSFKAKMYFRKSFEYIYEKKNK